MSQKKWRTLIRRPGEDPKKNRRVFGSILFGLTIFVFLLFIIRFVYIVGVGKIGKVSLDEKTQQLYKGSSVVKAKRGTIYDRNGDAIAEDATSYSLFVILDKEYLGIKNTKTGKREILYLEDDKHEQVADIFAKHLKMDKAKVLSRLLPKKNESGRPITQVEFGNPGKNITLEMRRKIEKDLVKEHVKGVYFNEHPARIYPSGVFSSYLIGYAQLADAEDESKGLTGVMGIEAAYDKELSGKDGSILFQKDSRQNQIPGTVVVEKKAVDGEDIYTTIDRNLQLHLEELLNQSVAAYNPEDITAILMEAKTGNILAAGQRPSFNPETKEGLIEKEGYTPVWENLLVETPFEPGSTMKVFTVAAAIETGVFNPNATFQTGHIVVDDTPIADHNPSGIGTITYRQALTWSSNVGMVKLQQMMDMKWLDYMDRFGFEKATDSKLPNESGGYIQKGTTVDRAMSAYGQALSVTPFQMVQGFTAIANGGKMLKPKYIDKFVENDGTEKKINTEIVGEPITADTATQVLDMMTDVVEDKMIGTGNAYEIEGFRVSAKTGTAQIFEPEKGTYAKDGYLTSVVQITPTENPKYIMYVTMRKPPQTESAEKMLAEISNSLLRRALVLDAGNQVEDTSNQE